MRVETAKKIRKNLTWKVRSLDDEKMRLDAIICEYDRLRKYFPNTLTSLCETRSRRLVKKSARVYFEAKKIALAIDAIDAFLDVCEEVELREFRLRNLFNSLKKHYPRQASETIAYLRRAFIETTVESEF